jgi:SAM-dependent methyltransferase
VIPTPKPPAPTSAWTRLWASGAGDSFGGRAESGSGATVPLQHHWLTALAELRGPLQLLDVGTGNGVLLRWLLQACQDTSVQCIGVDLAESRPAWLQRRTAHEQARLRFLPGVAAQQLPLADASIDLVLSQYGLEYAPLAAALDELARVLSPQGQLWAVMHFLTARPPSLAREELTHVSWLRSSGWSHAAREMTEAMSLVGHPAGQAELARSARWQAVRQRFDAAQAALQQRAASSPCPDLLHDAQQWIAQVFRTSAARGAAAGTLGFEALSRQVEDTGLRLQDLLTHALDEAAVQFVTDRLAHHGFNCDWQPLHDQGHLMGLWLQARRA